MPQGSISIVCTGDFVAACWNEMLTVAAEATGVVGLVIDGYVRDMAAMTQRGFTRSPWHPGARHH